MAEPRDLAPGDFDTVLRADVPVVVLFRAPWAAGGPALDALVAPFVAHFAHRVLFTRINDDEAPDLLVRFAVHTLPGVLVFSAGQLVAHLLSPIGPGDPLDPLAHNLRRTIYRLIGR
jgi:thioredoxin-like negative regulator of GroEL